MINVKVHIVYEARGVKNMWLKGHRISIEVFRNRSAMIIIYNKKGKQLEVFMLTKVYQIHKKRRK